MFKADTKLHRTDGSNDFDFRYLADFVIEYFDVSKKLTETAFCVTKNRFFLIRFLICVTEQQFGLLPRWGSAWLLYHSLLSLVKHFSQLFSDFFRNFFGIFSAFRKTFLRTAFLRDSFDIISYPISNVKHFSQLFSDFFRKVFRFLRIRQVARPSSRQLVHSITFRFDCQAFFATFFGSL